MNWLPTPIVRRAVPIRTVGMSVQDETGCRWMTLTIYGTPSRCRWCHWVFNVGWLADRFNDWMEVCARHIVVDWAAPWIDLELYGPALRAGPRDDRHQKRSRRRKAS